MNRRTQSGLFGYTKKFDRPIGYLCKNIKHKKPKEFSINAFKTLKNAFLKYETEPYLSALRAVALQRILQKQISWMFQILYSYFFSFVYCSTNIEQH